MPPQPNDDSAVLRELHKRSRRGFLVGGLAALAAFYGWRWLRTADLNEGVAWPLRNVLRFNERVARLFFRPNHPAPEFPGQGVMPRGNGFHGLGDFNAGAWTLRVEQPDAPDLTLSMADVHALPRVEMETELKCIEGWSTIVKWAGVRFRDFADHFNRGKAGDRPFPYVALETPVDDDGDHYYVGLDVESAMHPQTLLCYEMDGAPLTPAHGAPLRLVTPLKYGIKLIKRIGLIRFTDQRPNDFWAERGYDWYAGL